MLRVFRSIAIVLALSSFFVVALPVLAQTDAFGLHTTANAAQLAGTNRDLEKVIASIVKTLLTFTGILFLVMVIIAGEMLITAAGNPKQLETAQGMIKNAVIGIAIVLGAYVLTDFIIGEALRLLGR